MRISLFATLLLSLFASLVSAQTLGDISGEVKDPTGAMLPGVVITLTNQSTNAVRTAITNDSGAYSFPALVPGPYKVRAEKAGFKTSTSDVLELQVQQQARLDLRMEVGSVSESIEVVASGALLSTENATVGTVVDNKRIVELPLNGRNYLQLTALAPNVSYGFSTAGQSDARQGGDRSAQNISVAGIRNNFNRFTLDGVENTDPNFNSYVIFPSAEALQEFKVQSGIYPAEFGRGATQINVSTKGGGNTFHGAAYEFLRNGSLDGKQYDFTGRPFQKDPFRWNQFGFTLSGPVLIPKLFNGKNKLFFMTNYEWFRQRRIVQALYTLPNAGQRGGNFNDVVGGIFDPATRVVSGGSVTASPFPGNVIPTSRLAATSQKLLEFYPAPNIPGLLSQNHQIGQGRPVNKDQFIQRFDFNESARSQWFGRYSRSDENLTNEALQLNGTSIITKATQWMATNTRVITNSLVNETRFGYTKFYNTTGPELAFSRDVVGTLGIKGLASGPPVQWGIPGIGITGYSGFGNSSEGPYENNNSAMQVINNVSWIKGKHSLKFGGEFRRDQYNQVGNQFARGEFQFSGQATRNPAVTTGSGNAFADFLLGQLNQSEAAVAIASAQFRSTGFAFYVDDSWRVSSKLTIAMGLRYENTPPWEDQTGNLFNGIVPFDIHPARSAPVPIADLNLHPFFMRQGAPRQNCYEGISLRWTNIAVKCDGSLGNRLVGRDNNDWAPRLGISYQLSSKTVLRAGAGLFYSQDTGNPRFDMARNLAGRLRANPNPQIPNLNWDNALASIAGGVANVPTPYTFANPFNRRTPRTFQYLLNIQHELASSLVAEVGYIGNTTRHLESLRAVNESLPACRNIPAASDPNFARCSADVLRGIPERQRAPFPEFGRIQLVDNDGYGNYNSLGAKLTKRYSSGFTMLTSYTWSRSMDTSSGIRNPGNDTLFPQNSYCRSCEYARSAHDVRHRFVTSGQYDLPVGKGKRVNVSNAFADAVIGGWSVGSIVTLQSGFVQNVGQGGDPSNTGGQFDRPTATGQKLDLDSGARSPARWFNVNAFAFTPDGVFGNVGRNVLTVAGIVQWDFITTKSFRMPWAEGHNLQFRFEAYNFPNHANWSGPDSGIASGGVDPATGVGRNFGRITGTRGMRNMQMALRYTF
ncbi:MAG: TonB-dependent receptor [Acidobacteria bacterium]|nr:TonB-dependent receptor [Acidobacteriota bacterium]